MPISSKKFGFNQSSPSPPKSNNSGSLEDRIAVAMIKAQGIADLKKKMEDQRRGNLGSNIQDVKNQFGGNIPPGTSYNVDGLTAPLNKPFTSSEVDAVVGADKFEPLVASISALIDKGVLGKGFFQRPYNSFLAEGGGDWKRRLATPDDSDLETLASNVNEIAKYAFSEGGKNLTPTELQVVKGGLSLLGKGDNQIKNDLSEAIKILRLKKNVALQGRDYSPIGDTNNSPTTTNGNISNSNPTSKVYNLGQIVSLNGKDYKVVDVSNPLDPDLEEVV